MLMIRWDIVCVSSTRGARFISSSTRKASMFVSHDSTIVSMDLAFVSDSIVFLLGSNSFASASSVAGGVTN